MVKWSDPFKRGVINLELDSLLKHTLILYGKQYLTLADITNLNPPEISGYWVTTDLALGDTDSSLLKFRHKKSSWKGLKGIHSSSPIHRHSIKLRSAISNQRHTYTTFSTQFWEGVQNRRGGGGAGWDALSLEHPSLALYIPPGTHRFSPEIK